VKMIIIMMRMMRVIGTDRCTIVQIDTEWYRMVQYDTE